MTTWEEPPLTRRELRERERMLAEQAAAGAAPAPQQAPSAPALAPQFPPPAPAAGAVPPLQPAVPARSASGFDAAGFDAEATRTAPSAPPVPFSGGAAAAVPSFAPAPAAAPSLPSPQGFATAPAVPAPRVSAAADTPVPAAPAQAAPARIAPPERTLTRRELRAMLAGDDEFDELDDEPEHSPAASEPQATGIPQPAAATSTALAPARPRAGSVSTGHWADGLTAADTDEPQPFDQLLSRGGLAHGVPTTTSALILPVLPDGASLTTPQSFTGEIIVTGSIDLPRSFGATGARPDQLDSPDLDRLFDQVEDAPSTGVAPIAATRAIATQGPTRDYLAAPAKEGASMPLILAITAGVLALGVVATFVVGVVFRLF